MSLIVEDGSGLTNAESYLSVADADTYWANHGAPATWTSGVPTNSAKEQALRLATQYLDIKYGQRWSGRKKNFTQILTFPRYGVISRDGWLLDSASLPQALKDACAEMAFRSLTDDLFPDQTNPGDLKSELVKVGSIEIAQTFAGSQSLVKSYPKVDLMLADLMLSGNSVVRA